MPKDVLCEVDSCAYWSSGNQCSAEEIYVVNQHNQKATDSDETDCKTFEPKH